MIDVRKHDLNIIKKKLKQQQEDKKTHAIEKILNDEGKKLREKKREEIKKLRIEKDKEERQKAANLTKLVIKYSKDGNVTLRFPPGILIPKVLYQKSDIIENKENNNDINYGNKNCEVFNCLNKKRYRDPKSGKYYCSLGCYKKLQLEINKYYYNNYYSVYYK